MRVLIIGRNGFIAKSLTEYFADKQDIHLEICGHGELDVLNEKKVDSFFEDRFYDVVINCAVWSSLQAPAWEKNMEVENDLRMFINLLKNSEHTGKLINFGSGAEFDKSENIVAVSEKAFGPQVPQNAYGFAKYVMNLLAEQSRNIYNLRIFGLYGKYEDYKYKFITGACCKAVLGLPITIRQNATFDYLYMDDFCEMVYRFIKLEKPKYHSYNITSGMAVDLRTLADIVCRVSGKDLPIVICKTGLGNEYTGDNSRLLSEIGNIDFTPHEKAIEVIYRYYAERAAEIDSERLLY